MYRGQKASKNDHLFKKDTRGKMAPFERTDWCLSFRNSTTYRGHSSFFWRFHYVQSKWWVMWSCIVLCALQCDANPEVSKVALMEDKYENVLTLITYYQMVSG